MKQIQGIGVSPGIAIGKVFSKETLTIQMDCRKIEDVNHQINRFKEAREKGKKQLQALYEHTLEKVGKSEAQIFSSHAMIIDDIEFYGKVENKIEKESINAEHALKCISDEFVQLFEAMENQYLKERAMDIRDVTLRLMKNLVGIEEGATNLEEEAIIIAKDLTPSDTAQLDKSKVLGFITEIGGKTSHTAIMARTLEIPAIVGVDNICIKVSHGDQVIFDGQAGIIYVNPDQDTLNKYIQKKTKFERRKALLQEMKGKEGITLDGIHLEVGCNIGQPEDIQLVIEKGGDSVGLFRTEFIYMNRTTFPSEEEQYTAYKTVAQKMKGKPIVIRTFDIGGDKELDYLKFPEEINPFLGHRAIRFCLERIDLFKIQLRAILRASSYGNIKLMFPMIATIEELRQSKRILEEVKEGLRNEGMAFNEAMEVGMMMETPAAAILADFFAKEVDFFSIGTNDLIQYIIAVDRLNPHVSHLYTPFNPAVLRTIKQIIDAGHKAGIWVGMCGEAASEPRLVPLLIGMGLDEFSMNPASVLEVKWSIRQYAKNNLEAVVNHIMTLATAEEIENYLETIVKRI